MATLGVRARAQASAIPSAQSAPLGTSSEAKGRVLLDQMMAALGGDAWRNRSTWVLYGQTSHFYKGAPDPYVSGFEEYYRAQPFAERVVVIAHGGALTALGLPGHDIRDVGSVWTPENGYEVTYKGKKELPKEDVAEFQRLRRHSLDTVVLDWLKHPGVAVDYGGTAMVERRLADQVTLTTADNDTVVLKLDESTHLPLSLSFKYRNETYKDYDNETVEYENYQPFQGVMTPLTVTRYKNGELVAQRFITKAEYNVALPAELFNPDNAVVPKLK
jgi:hypothetical protein